MAEEPAQAVLAILLTFLCVLEHRCGAIRLVDPARQRKNSRCLANRYYQIKSDRSHCIGLERSASTYLTSGFMSIFRVSWNTHILVTKVIAAMSGKTCRDHKEIPP